LLCELKKESLLVAYFLTQYFIAVKWICSLSATAHPPPLAEVKAFVGLPIIPTAPAACACCTSNIPVIAVPIANVRVKPMPKVTSFGCAATMFRSFALLTYG
jgi:hypothetical protein